MHKLQYIIFGLIAILIDVKKIKAQLPFNDTAWVLQTSSSDEFNTTTFKSMWNLRTYYPDSANNGAEFDYPKNDSLTGSMLVIKADTLKPNHYKDFGNVSHYRYNTPPNGLTYAYQGGMIQNTDTAYRFGYIEISAKYPSKKYPLWPAFWMQYGTAHYYNEIDVTENGAGPTFDGNKVGNNWAVSNTSGTPVVGNNVTAVLPSTDSLSGAFHTYAVEWNPKSFTYYFDHKATVTVYDSTRSLIPQHGMTLILNFCIDPYYAKLPADWTGKAFQPDTTTGVVVHNLPNPNPVHWPQYFIIDYVRYYKLPIIANCTNTLSICIPSDYSSRDVRKSITVGGGSCSPTYNPTNISTSYTLRATDYVELDAGTTINSPTGTGYFAIDITACPQ